VQQASETLAIALITEIVVSSREYSSFVDLSFDTLDVPGASRQIGSPPVEAGAAIWMVPRR
jgi:hypothetical protein